MAVLGAAPRPRVLAADVYCHDVTEAHRLLRNEGVFAALRVRKLHFTAPVHDEDDVLALASDLAAHAYLANIYLLRAPLGTLAALDAVVDAAIGLRVHTLLLYDCNLTPASAPALARLIRGGALTELDVLNFGVQLLDQPAAALVADALRANSTLTSLKLQACGLWQDAAGAALLLGALTAHRSLRTLDLSTNFSTNFIDGDHQVAAALGAALGARVAADAPALHELNVSASRLGDAGLGPLVDALSLNTHLRMLRLADNHCTEAFIRDRLLPAVRANTSLRHLSLQYTPNELMREAEALVAARNAAAAP